MGFDLIASITAATVSVIGLFLTKSKIDIRDIKAENEEIDNSVKKVVELANDSDDIIDLMMKNVAELREYYVISKRQATKAFSASLIVCFLGIIIYISGIAVLVYNKQNILLLSTISGTVVEVIAGLFFWLYSRSIQQLNLYHKRLGTTEKYLTAIKLVEKMSENKKDERYSFIMESILIDNRIQTETNKNNIEESQ